MRDHTTLRASVTSMCALDRNTGPYCLTIPSVAAGMQETKCLVETIAFLDHVSLKQKKEKITVYVGHNGWINH